MTNALYCASCGRNTNQGPDQIEPVLHLGLSWCPLCASVGIIDGQRFVNQPSPGQLYESPPANPLDAWQDCYEFRPKKRIRVAQAKCEIQRAWKTWSGADRSDAKMYEFYWWAYRHHPFFLTFRCKHDRWQQVHSWLLEFERSRSSA